MQSKKFQDKVVVVTGGASGIGKSLVEAFAQSGASVAAVDLHNAQKIVDNLPISNPSARYLALDCDVSDPSQVRSTIRNIKNHFGRIDIYCSNAGIVLPTVGNDDNVVRHSDDQWNKIWKINVQSHIIATRELLPDWEQGRGQGVFMVTASAAGLLTQIGDASYGVSKAAAVSFAEHLAIANPNLRVHCLCPQAVDTPLIARNATTAQSRGSPAAAALTDGLLSPDVVAEVALQAIEEGTFWVFPHERIPHYVHRKALDHTRWLKGMQRFRLHLFSKM
eukprot:Nitzschia sp. Nitz4//scaffold40_size135432//48520//49353//NITZ4_003238-RA/size135432-exonerate_est2genome-gene-0.134-mRNA-1//1//CDS//3329551201//4568//frame0